MLGSNPSLEQDQPPQPDLPQLGIRFQEPGEFL